ncbi:hypothetical protein [Xanthomonas pisi]|uniref:hypothetical protein n=1 Tax=Xanthomonas pisi TaxID=56457 RepID=UPI003CCE42B9
MRGAPFNAAYRTSKAAIRMLSKCMGWSLQHTSLFVRCWVPHRCPSFIASSLAELRTMRWMAQSRRLIESLKLTDTVSRSASRSQSPRSYCFAVPSCIKEGLLPRKLLPLRSIFQRIRASRRVNPDL